MNSLPVDSLKLDNQLCFKLYAASRAVIRAYKPMLDQLGLTYPQYLAMLVLWEWQDSVPEQPTVKALGERLALDSGTLTPLLKRLEQLHLVQRQRSARDEREVHLSLSPAGQASGHASARIAMSCAVHSPTPHSASNGVTLARKLGPGSKICGLSSSACATPDKVRPRLRGMPRVARSACANTAASGNRWLKPGAGDATRAP